MGYSDRGNARESTLTRSPTPESFLRYAPVIALALAVGRLAAQDTTAAAKSAPPPLGPRCNGETVSVVTITRGEPVMVERSTGALRPFLRFALAGVPTRESAIAPFLLVKQGLVEKQDAVARAVHVEELEQLLAP